MRSLTIAILTLAFVSSLSPGRESKANEAPSPHNLKWEGLLAVNEEGSPVYALGWSGIFGAESSSNLVRNCIEDWLHKHPAAEIRVTCKSKDDDMITLIWVEDDSENLSIHLAREGAIEGSIFVDFKQIEIQQRNKRYPKDLIHPAQRYVSNKEYDDFIQNVQKAERFARTHNRGIYGSVLGSKVENPEAVLRECRDLMELATSPSNGTKSAVLDESDWPTAIKRLKPTQVLAHKDHIFIEISPPFSFRRYAIGYAVFRDQEVPLQKPDFEETRAHQWDEHVLVSESKYPELMMYRGLIF